MNYECNKVRSQELERRVQNAEQLPSQGGSEVYALHM